MTNNFNNLESERETVQTSTETFSPLLDINPEKEQENIETVKKQWQKRQHSNFKRICHEESQNKNIKVIVSSFVGVTLIALASPHVANWWITGHNAIIESSSEETAEDGSEKGGFLNKLKDLKEEGEGEGNSGQVQGEVKQKGKKATMAEQLEESVDSIKKNKDNLRKAIQLSDGKDVQLGTETEAKKE